MASPALVGAQDERTAPPLIGSFIRMGQALLPDAGGFDEHSYPLARTSLHPPD